MSPIVKVVIFSLSSVVYLFILSKLLGKKQIAQLDFIDYVMGISIGSIAAEMATDTSQNPFYYYIIAMGIFFLFDVFVTLIARKGTALKHFFKGKPATVIYEGKLNYKTLKKCGIDVNDVLSMCREKGYFNINDVAYAVFETSGKLSVLPKGHMRPTVAEDLRQLNIEQASLPIYLVVDGEVSYSSLNEIGKDEKWLMEKLQISSTKELKQILLAIYDEQTRQVALHKKIKDV